MKRLLQVFCLISWLSTSLFAQTATISGTVRDQSGAVLPGVDIRATNSETSLNRAVVTNERGDYVIPQLPVGNYEVKAELPGFKTGARQVVLQVDQRVPVNFDMQVGEVTEKVLVTGSAPLVQSETSSVGAVIENKRIVELPLNGRDFQNLAMLVPGTATAAQGSSLGFRGGIAVAGTRDAMTGFTLDGVDIVNGLVKAISFKPSIDMIQEFKVQTSTYSAEYGRTAGGQVVVTTKSGTNQLHGTVYEFLRNSAMDAKNFFDPAGPIPPFKRNNFGFTFGGPIIKDRTFFFGNYEGLIFRQAQTRTAAVPPPAMVNGNFSDIGKPIIDPLTGVQFTGNVIPANRMDPVGIAIARTFPAPNLTGGGSRNFVSTPIDSRDIHQFTVRIDHRFSDKDNFYGRYSFSNDYEDDPFDVFSGITNLPGYGRLDSQRAMSVSLTETHVFNPTLLAEFRLGYNRYKQIRTQEVLKNIAKQWGIAGASLSNNPRDWGYPAVRTTGFDAIGKTNLPSDRVDPIYQLMGSITITRSGHTIKIGADANQFGSMRLNNGGGNGTFSFTGEYTGNGLADLLLGYPRSATRTLGDTRNPLWSEAYDAYIQDDWRLTQRLTLNLGARYDLQSPYRSADDRLVRFNPQTENIEIVGKASTRRDIGSVANPASPFYNAEAAQFLKAVNFVDLGKRNNMELDKNDFAPRIGLAYRILDNDRLVLRTGYGVFYQYLQGNTGQSGWNSLPFFVSQTFNASLPRPNIFIANPFPAALASSSLNPPSNAANYHTGYVQHYNIGVQFQPLNDLLVDIAYVGNVSRKLSNTLNINQPPASPTGSVASRRPYQGFANISFLDSTASANFNSMQVRVEKRYARGYSIAGSYTWSKSLDTVGDGTGDSGPPNNYDIRGTMYGPSSSDVRQRLVLSYVYDLPVGTGKRFMTNAPGAARWLVSGWEISGIGTSQAGRPFTVSVTADNSNTGGSNVDRPVLVGNPDPGDQKTIDHWFNGSAFQLAPRGTYGNVGRNTIVGPAYNTIDLSLIKNGIFSEGKNVQFRAEFFNIMNHPNFDLPNRFADSVQAGQIFSAESPRQIQLGLKIIY